MLVIAGHSLSVVTRGLAPRVSLRDALVPS